MAAYKVLFVCTGNICRSPTAEGVFRKYLTEHKLQELVQVDSAGTHGWHIGKPADARTLQAAYRRGLDISMLRARKVQPEDFRSFDLILAMDDSHISALRAQCPPDFTGQMKLLMDFAQDWDESHVPDPYYGDDLSFERVLDMIEDASRGLLTYVQAQLKRSRKAD